MKRLSLLLLKIIYMLLYFVYIVSSRFEKNKKISKFFLKFNNYIVKKRVKERVGKVCVLLPHCIQNYDCVYKITSVTDNCRSCGGCGVGDILKLKKTQGVDIKVVTGGTLARKHLKETRPYFVVAVACERDLISGIYDAFPLPVYGLFNKRPNGPCINTEMEVEEIEHILNEFRNG